MTRTETPTKSPDAGSEIRPRLAALVSLLRGGFRRDGWWLVPLSILIYSTALAWGATEDYFNPGEVTHLYAGWQRPFLDLAGSILSIWNNSGGLLGLLYLKMTYGVFGFHLLPFRLATLVVCAVNLVLLNALLGRLVQDRRARYMALLAGSFHGAMWTVYASSAAIFDVLCQTFTIMGVLHYASTRERPMGAWGYVAIALWTNLAIASHAAGFVLPPILLAYEWILVRARLGGYDWRDLRRAVPRLGASFAAALVAGLGPLSDYQITAERLLEVIKAHSEALAFKLVSWPASTWVAILVLWLAIAIAARSRLAVFGWVFYNLAVLPLAFAPQRTDVYVLCVALAGCAIYMAGLLEQWLKHVRSWVAVAAIAMLIITAQVRQRSKVRGRFGMGGQGPIYELAGQLRLLHPSLPQGARILLVNDETDQAALILRLAYRDASLVVEKLRTDGPPEKNSAYDHVFRLEGNRYIEVK